MVIAAVTVLVATAFQTVSATECKAVLEAGDNTATSVIMPFAHCLSLMENKQADILSSIVAIPDKIEWSKLKFDCSTAERIKIVFVLFTNKNKPVAASELKKGNPRKLKIETDAGHIAHFGVAIEPSTNIDGGLQKVENGLSDGYIFSQAAGDAALKRLALKNVKREYFDTWSGVFVIARGARGGAVAKMLSAVMEIIKKSGKYQEIMGKLVEGASEYIDWQP